VTNDKWARSSVCAASFHTSAEKTTVYIQNRRHIIGHLSFVTRHSLGSARPKSPLNYLMMFKYAFATIFGALTTATKIELPK